MPLTDLACCQAKSDGRPDALEVAGNVVPLSRAARAEG